MKFKIGDIVIVKHNSDIGEHWRGKRAKIENINMNLIYPYLLRLVDGGRVSSRFEEGDFTHDREHNIKRLLELLCD